MTASLPLAALRQRDLGRAEDAGPAGQEYRNPYRDESQFRAGELLFDGEYVKAEQAYETVLHKDNNLLY